MISFSGKFQYLESTGQVIQSGSCRITVEKETFLLTPEKGAPLAFDFGDIDAFSPGDYQLSVKLYTGKSILLSQFGKTFQNLSHDLLEAYRGRLIQCLLLEDLEEIKRFDGLARLESADGSFSSPAELRLYKSNLAVIPESATGLQWRLADIDVVELDQAAYTVTVLSGRDRLLISKLAKRTEDFRDSLQSAIQDISEKSARTVHELLPFLNPDQFQKSAELLKEGRAVAASRLKAVHPQIVPALLENTVDAGLRPYFEFLRKKSGDDSFFTGFKLIWREEEAKEEGEAESVPVETDGGGQQAAPAKAQPSSEAAGSEEEAKDREGDKVNEEPVLHWFFFPLKMAAAKGCPNMAAWECTSRSGRATYFFRLFPENLTGAQDPAKASPEIENAIQRLNRAFLLLNFRREPIYLPDDTLEIQPRYRRYAVACRKIPVLKGLRRAFLGRAIHTSPEAWQNQVESILAKQ